MNERILVIDDDKYVRDSVSFLLELSGYCVMTAANGKIALKAFQSSPADLVLTDIFMPEAEGFETMKGLRALAPGLPIIVWSGAIADSSIDFLAMAKQLGATAILPKPFDSLGLLPLIEKCLRQTGTPDLEGALNSESLFPDLSIGEKFMTRRPRPEWEAKPGY